jgi:hypothetical protein
MPPAGTFRHRRRSGEARHDHALKALAIRKNQIHVLGKVAWSYSGTPVYTDVEGDPDRDFYYCIGIRFEAAGSIVRNSYWADDKSDEEKDVAECLAALSHIDEPRLIHYGNYETSFLRQMKSAARQSHRVNRQPAVCRLCPRLFSDILYVFVQEIEGPCIGRIFPDIADDDRYPCPGTPAIADSCNSLARWPYPPPILC